MSSETRLEQRIQILEDIEAIKKLKARYWHSVDRHQWDDLTECLAEDFVFESPFLGRMEGRNYIVKVLKRAMKEVKTAHHGHNPEIEIINDSSARAVWTLNDRVETPDKKVFKGYGGYDDEYIKENGSWKVKTSILTYIFQEGSLDVLH
jgi:hypothetical protein